MLALTKGQLVDLEGLSVHANSITAAYGTLIFDAFRMYKRRDERLWLFRPDRHYDRFMSGLEYFGARAPYSYGQFFADVSKIVEGNRVEEDCYFKIIASWGEPSRTASLFCLQDYATSISLIPNTTLRVFPDTEVRLMIVDKRRNPFQLPPHLKTSANYFHFRALMPAAVSAGFNNLLFTSEAGYVTETIDSAIIFVKNGKCITPSLSTGILPSVTRESVIEVLRRSMRVMVDERDVLRIEAEEADEAFVCNSAYVVRSVAQVNHRKLRVRGEICSELCVVLDRLLRADVSGYESFFQPLFGDSHASR